MMNTVEQHKLQWKKRHLIPNSNVRITLKIIAVLYLYFGIVSVDINWIRVYEGAGRAMQFVLAFLTPDFKSQYDLIVSGILESLAMTAVATIAGVFIGLPIAFGAAKNVSPKPVYIVCRAFVVISRTFTEIIIAIFFVVIVGFGPFAGVLTLTLSGAGFIAKLLGEDIESINPEQLEAIRATGAPWWATLVYGVWPQVKPRFLGLSLYRMDINFRNSSVLGIVGAGGIGSTLDIAFARYEYSVGAAILIIIVALVLIAEYISGKIRERIK